jgi:hypothetical protein
VIQGFPEDPSALPGQRVMLRVATRAAEWRFHVHRQGARLEHCHSSAWIEGHGFRGDEHIPSDDWGKPGTRPDGGPAAGWTGYVFEVPAAWRSGAYVFTFEEGDGQGRPLEPTPDLDAADARTGKALLVLRSATPGADAEVLYKLPVLTYQAYNTAGGASIYQRVDVSLRRPGGGTGGVPWDSDTRWVKRPNHDPWDLATPRQSFAHWDAKMIAWLESEHYRVDYVTDWDLHQPRALAWLAEYALVVSAGHDEYYTEAMRAHLEAFVDGGGNVAFLSGNTCWWRAVLDEHEPHRLHGQQKIRRWSDAEVGRPEDALTGDSFRHGGEGDHDRAAIGYTVQHSGAWPFEGTGLADGDVIGQADGLVGYECDGAPYDKHAPPPHHAVLTPGAGTPADFVILATADVAVFDNEGNKGATMGLHRRGDGGTVFTASTTDWPRVVAAGDPRVATITRNLVDRLAGEPRRAPTREPLDDALACDGCFGRAGEPHLALVGSLDGGVHAISSGDDEEPTCVTRVTTIEGLRDLGDGGVDDDGPRHAIVATEDGDVLDLAFAPATPRATLRRHLGHFEGAFRVALSHAAYEHESGVAHAVVATDRGQVYVITQRTETRAIVRIGNFPDVVDVGAFHDPAARVTHVVVGQGDGTISSLELSARADTVTRRASLGRIAGLSRLHAYGIPGDTFFPHRVLVTTRDGRHHELRHRHGSATIRVARGRCVRVTPAE